MKEGVLLQPLTPACNTRQRNRQGKSVAWTNTSSDEYIPLDDEFGDDMQPLCESDDEEPSDKIEESGGKVDNDKVPKHDPQLLYYWILTKGVLVIRHMKPRTKLFSPSEATLNTSMF